MKKVLVFFTVVLFVIVSNNMFSYASDISVKREAGYISLNDSMTKDVEPDIAKITFSVENTALDAQKASIENNVISNAIINALKLIINNKNDVIKTNNFTISPVYSSTSTGKKVIKNYTAVNSIIVETKDISKVAKIIDTAIKNGANRTDNLYYSIENEKNVCNELYPVLLKDIKQQAAVLALSVGTSIDGIKQINASCSTDTFVSNGRFSAKMDTASLSEEALSTPIESGKVKVRIYVNADFYVK